VTRTLAALPDGASPVWTASNHDISRFPTRWCGADERKIRLALLILATLPGAVVLYYGDEIGMTDVVVPPELQRDAMTRGVPGARFNRDRARTPMRWDGSAGAGFTAAGVAPWLPFGPATATVADQRDDPGSVLSLCRRLLALRRAELGGGAGYRLLPSVPGVWAYRTGPLVVAANFGPEQAQLPAEAGAVLLRTGQPAARLGPAEGLIAQAR